MRLGSISSSGKIVVKYYETGKSRLQGRVLPAPQPQPHNVISAM